VAFVPAFFPTSPLFGAFPPPLLFSGVASGGGESREGQLESPFFLSYCIMQLAATKGAATEAVTGYGSCL